jgi:hypothetical protein
VTKRSSTQHFVLVEPELLTKNEQRFFMLHGLTPIAVPLARASEILQAA